MRNEQEVSKRVNGTIIMIIAAYIFVSAINGCTAPDSNLPSDYYNRTVPEQSAQDREIAQKQKRDEEELLFLKRTQGGGHLSGHFSGQGSQGNTSAQIYKSPYKVDYKGK